MIEETVNGIALSLTTSENLFSPHRLDRGTRAMLSRVSISPDMKVLDLGCGAGWVGLYAAHFTEPQNVFMIDIDENAVKCAKENALRCGLNVNAAVSDGFRDFAEAGFDLILSNPPYQSDFAVAKHFIEKGFNRLKLGGKMMMVTKRRPWYENKLRAIFGGCKVEEIDGYFVFTAEKRSATYFARKKQP